MSDDIAISPPEDSLIDEVAEWLMSQALGDTEISDLFGGCCARLHAAGIPLTRGYVAFRTLHPLFGGVGLIWRREDGVATEGYRHGDIAAGTDTWAKSPMAHIVENKLGFLRRRLTGEDALLDFPLLEEFRDQGATDYLAFSIAFGEIDAANATRNGIVGSWTTDRPKGFTDDDVQSLRRIQRRLAVACKITIKTQIAQNVLDSYLGPSSGRRVLEGQIQRGDGETIHAVI